LVYGLHDAWSQHPTQAFERFMIDDYEQTSFEPTPFGARQRVLPRHTFRAAPTMPRIVAPPVAAFTAPVMYIPIHHPPAPAPAPALPAADPPRWLLRFGVSLSIIVLALLISAVYP
jgi:hypothetical protein